MEYKDPGEFLAKVSAALDLLPYDASIRDIDCNDMPCMAYGEMPKGDGNLEKARKLLAGEYGENDRIFYTKADYGDEARQLFALGVMPANASEEERQRAFETLTARNMDYFSSASIAGEEASEDE